MNSIFGGALALLLTLAVRRGSASWWTRHHDTRRHSKDGGGHDAEGIGPHRRGVQGGAHEDDERDARSLPGTPTSFHARLIPHHQGAIDMAKVVLLMAAIRK